MTSQKIYGVVYNRAFGGFEISEKCIEWLARRGVFECIQCLEARTHGELRLAPELPRHHPLLVMAVQCLGENASAVGSDIGIAWIQNCQYRIEEYYGRELVVTPDSLTWIIIE